VQLINFLNSFLKNNDFAGRWEYKIIKINEIL
jgi:hypothetical protein